MQRITFPATDGYTLAGMWAVPVAEHKGTVIINPATGVRKEYYRAFAEYLLQAGYRVLLYDYRGIGGSAPATLKGFDAHMHEWATKDMNAALCYALSKKDTYKVIWVGHSIGAQLMGLLQNSKRIKRVVAVSASTGYWNHFPAPYNLYTLALWKVVGPLMIKRYGYVPMDKIGWGQPLPKGVWLEWRSWCLSKNHFQDFLLSRCGVAQFNHFTAPITAVHATDDYIANSKTVRNLLRFYPSSKHSVIALRPRDFGVSKIGHTGIFRKGFRNNIWPLLLAAAEGNTPA